MKISVVICVPMKNRQTILHHSLPQTGVQAYFSSVAAAARSVSSLISEIKVPRTLFIQEIHTGGQNMDPLHTVCLLEKPVQACIHLSKVGWGCLNHQPYAEEDNVQVQRLPTKLFQRISFPTVISALLSLAFRGLLTPQTNSNPWLWKS